MPFTLSRQGWLPRLASTAVISTPTLVSLFLHLAIPSAAYSSVNPQLEKQILETIQKHPEVILESLDRYRQHQQQEKAEKAQKAVLEIRNNPKSLLGESPILGNNQGKQYLFVFIDFQCPFCAKVQTRLKQFQKKYPQVALVYKHYPLTRIHPEAMSAAAASWAAHQQGKFWAYHDILIANQDRLNSAYYEEVAKQLGMNLSKFNRDRQSQSSKLAIADDIALGDKLGIRGTPFLVINGQSFYGVVTDQQLENAISAPTSSPSSDLR